MTTIKGKIEEQLKNGIELSRDPTNQNLATDEVQITTIYSSWYKQECPVCGNLFREKDKVRICPKCKQAYHEDDFYNLFCWSEVLHKKQGCSFCDYMPDELFEQTNFGRNKSKIAGAVREEFLEGLETVWKPFGEEKVIIVPEGSQIVGRTCPMCGFKIRVGDRVVKCPCGDACGTYFHDDVFRQLECWNDWNGRIGKKYCPTSGKPYAQKFTQIKKGDNAE